MVIREYLNSILGLPSKPGQCPFLVPPPTGAGEDICSVSCSSDDECSGDDRCCSTGCGTKCMQPEVKTYCQHLHVRFKLNLLSIYILSYLIDMIMKYLFLIN